MNWKRLFIWFIYANQRFYVVRIIRCICAKIKTVIIKSVADLMSLYAQDVCRSCCEKNLFQKLSSVTDGKIKIMFILRNNDSTHDERSNTVYSTQKCIFSTERVIIFYRLHRNDFRATNYKQVVNNTRILLNCIVPV